MDSLLSFVTRRIVRFRCVAAALVLAGLIAGAAPARANTLNAGDLAVVGWNSVATGATPDTVTIVTLVSMPAGTVIKFTDKGWDQATNAFTTTSTGDGVVTWTTSSPVPAGTVLQLFFGGSDQTTTLTNVTTNASLTADIAISTYTVTDPLPISGDGVFIYQDSDVNPYFIFGLNNSAGTLDGTNWNTSIAATLRDSMLPNGIGSQNALTNGVNAIGLPGGASQFDNVQYTGPTATADRATWMARLTNLANWTGENVGSTTTSIGITPGSALSLSVPNSPPTVVATSRNPTFTEGAFVPADFFENVTVSTVEGGQVITEIVFTVSGLRDGSSEQLQVDGRMIPLTHGSSGVGLFNGVSASVSVAGNVATVTATFAGGMDTTLARIVIDSLGYLHLSAAPTGGPRVVTLTTLRDSGGGTDTATPGLASTVAVVPVNGAPAISAGGLAFFVEATSGPSTPVVVGTGIVVDDIDHSTLASATVCVDINFSPGDVLAFANDGASMGNISGVYVSGTGVLSLSSAGATATLAQWQAALRVVTFTNVSAQPSTAVRTVSFQVNDGGAASNTAGANVFVQATNNPPSVTAPTSIAVTEDVASVLTGISFGDVDAGSASVTATLSVGSGTLTALSSGGVTVSGAGTSTLTLAGSVANLNAFTGASSVAFTTAENATVTVTLTVAINDGGNSGGAAETASTTAALLVTAVNDAPTISAPTTIAATESTASALTGLSVADVDAGTSTVTTTLAVGTGTLLATSGGGVMVSGTGTGTLTLSGSVGNVNAFLAAGGVSFTSDYQVPGNVTLSLAIDDGGNTGTGGAQTASATATITVAPLPVTQLIVTAPTSVLAGDVFDLVVTAKNAEGRTVTGYTGPVSFSTTDPIGQLPPNQPLVAGTGTFPAYLLTAGQFTITVADAATPSIAGTTAVITSSAQASLSALDATAGPAAADTGMFRFGRTGGVSAPMTVSFQFHASSTATVADFALSGASVTLNPQTGAGTVVIPADADTALVTVTPLAPTNGAASPARTVRLAVTPNAAYEIGTPGDDTVTIAARGLVVTTTDDSGVGSLRQAVANANAAGGPATITFGGATFTDPTPDVITLTTAALAITGNVTIAGPGAGALTISGNQATRILHAQSGAALTLSGLELFGGRAVDGGAIFHEGTALTASGCTFRLNRATLTGGAVSASGGSVSFTDCVFEQNTAQTSGGAILIGGGTLGLSRCTFFFNRGLSGGAIIAGSTALTAERCTFINNLANGSIGGALYSRFGSATLEQCTLSGNSSDQKGGGVYASESALTLRLTTIYGNSAEISGGGIWVDRSPVTLDHTIIAHSTGGDVASFQPTVNLLGKNLVEDGSLTGTGVLSGDPLLGSLAENGGPTLTRALLPGSPALDAGDANFDATNFPTDQRGVGYSRVAKVKADSAGAIIDLGATEAHLPATPTLAVSTLTRGNAEDAIDLAAVTQPQPAGGVFSGTGVNAGGFDPAASGTGVKTITYTVTDTLGFTASTTLEITVTVSPAPVVTIGAPSEPRTVSGPVTFPVSYTGPFSGVTLDAGDITLVRTGDASAVIGVNGSGASHTVTLSSITGEGTIGIRIAAGTATNRVGVLAASADSAGSVTVAPTFTEPYARLSATTTADVPGEPAGTRLVKLGLPSVDARQIGARVTFKPEGGKETAAIFHSERGIIARVGAEAPGLTPATFAAFQEPVFGGGKVAFGAKLAGSKTAAATAASLWSDLGGALALVARAGDAAPEIPGATFASFASYVLADDASAFTFTAKIKGPGVTKANDFGVWQQRANGTRLLFRTGEVLNLTAGPQPVKSLRLFAPAKTIPGQRRAYTGQSGLMACASFPDGTCALLAPGVNAPDQPLASIVQFENPAIDAAALPAMNGQRHFALRAKFKAGTPLPFDPQTLASAANDTAIVKGLVAPDLTALAQEGGLVPGTTADRFAAFDEPAINDFGAVAFLATVKRPKLPADQTRALLWHRIPPAGGLAATAVIARTGFPAEGLTAGEKWKSFDALALPDFAYGPVLLAKLAGPGVKATNNLGLWAMDPFENWHLLVRTGDLFDVNSAEKTVSLIATLGAAKDSPGQGRYLDRMGSVAVCLTFTDRTRAYVRFTVPDSQ